MAQRRMFSKDVTNTSEFLMMSQSAQNLYFHAGMNCDDDGFFEVFAVMRMTESKPDDLNALHARGFIYAIDGKVAIVKHWHENNQIRADRYTRSKYFDDQQYREIYLSIMHDKIKELGVYRDVISGNQVATKRQPAVAKTASQYRLGKDRLVNTNTNTSQAVANAPDVEKNEVYLYWENTIAPITTTQETQRRSAVTLTNKFGEETCMKMIRVVAHAHANQYARKEVKVQSLGGLLNSWDKIVIYARSQASVKPNLVSV